MHGHTHCRRLTSYRVVLALLASAGICHANGGPAHFWLSTSATSSAGPEAPTLNTSVGSVETLYLWARPVAGKKIRNVSLNLVADATGVDFDDGSYVVHNTVSATVTRFGFFLDSSTSPELTSEKTQAEVSTGQIDSLLTLQGFKIGSDPDIRGMGPGCLPGDVNCFEASDGMPAWLLGQVDINATGVGTVNLRLQIGALGINHETVPPGDYNYDGTADTSDLAQWAADFASLVLLSADGNANGVVDAADYTLWRDHDGTAGVVELASLTEVVFGVDRVNGVDEPEHNGATDRSTNLAGDDADLVVVITTPAAGTAIGVPEPGSNTLLMLGLVLLGRNKPIKKREHRPTTNTKKN